jgi:hypothetical protein
METTIAQLQFLVDTINRQEQTIKELREQISILKKEIE